MASCYAADVTAYRPQQVFTKNIELNKPNPALMSHCHLFFMSKYGHNTYTTHLSATSLSLSCNLTINSKLMWQLVNTEPFFVSTYSKSSETEINLWSTLQIQTVNEGSHFDAGSRNL